MTKIQKTKTIFYPGLAGSPYYRIPTLLMLSNGTLIAGADQRNTTELDWGKINPVFRFKRDNEFTEPHTIINMDGEGTKEPPFNIDICLVEQKQGENAGRIYMLIDTFKSGGNYWTAEVGTGFEKIEGESYLQIFSVSEKYLVNQNGVVFTENLASTDLKVKVKDMMPFTSYGNIYMADELIGNIYKDNSPYQVHQTPFLWLLHSDDGGTTWQGPVDITAQVTDDKMKFVGTGPGRGLELKNGRLAFPIYFSVFDKDGEVRQNTAVVYTDDGENFKRSQSVNDTDGYVALDGTYPINTSEAQLIECANGDVWIFLRNDSGKVRYAVSTDNCETFSSQYEVDFTSESYCMVSVVYFTKDDKEYILLTNPAGPDRKNGSIKLMEILADNKVKTTEEYPINETDFSYSCIEQIGENEFAVLYEELADYEGEMRQHLKYFEFILD